MEAESVEDGGKGIKFNVYVYNIQPDIIIDYKTGDNRAEDDDEKEAAGTSGAGKVSVESEYILNTSTHKFHRPDCAGVKDMKEKNKKLERENLGLRQQVENLRRKDEARYKSDAWVD